MWNKPLGLAGVWGNLVTEWLDALLPEEISELQRNQLYITVTPINPFKPPVLLSHFENKNDIIHANRASTHIPFFMNKRPYTKYRNNRYLDGSFWSFVSRTRVHKIYSDPLPDGINSNDVLQLRWQDDLLFSGINEELKFTTLITPDRLYEMMDYGYNYMKVLDIKQTLDFHKK